MQQQPPQMFPSMSSMPPANITTEQIQKYLEENKKLIMDILENQKLGKLPECAQYQAQLQKNLMYLAAIADAQPQAPSLPPQVPQQGGFSMQHPQAAMAMAQQQGVFPPNVPLQFNNPHHMQDPRLQQQLQQLQYQQAMQGQMAMGPGGLHSGMHPMHTETMIGGGSSSVLPPNTGTSDARGGNKQDASEAGSSGVDGQGSAAAGHGGGDVTDEAK